MSKPEDVLYWVSWGLALAGSVSMIGIVCFFGRQLTQ